MDPAWAPDGSHVAFICYRQQRAKTKFNEPYLGPYEGPDGYQLREICVSDLERNEVVQLTDDLNIDMDPSWSPDGQLIVFASSRGSDDGTNIFVMQSDGTNLTQLTRQSSAYRRPRWAPEGERIAFVLGNAGGDLLTIDSDGSQLKRLIEGGVTSFDWSPSGGFIVCDVNTEQGKEIYMVDTRNGSVHRLTNNDALEVEPVWSPDGRRIAFGSDRSGTMQVYVMDVDALRTRMVSDGEDVAWGVSWSPDGQYLSYLRGHGENTTLAIISLGSETVDTIDNFQTYDTPLWAPNGDYLIYARTEDWNGDGFMESKLYTMRIDDGSERSVSSGTR
jgi:Tol biopolymer transport system component